MGSDEDAELRRMLQEAYDAIDGLVDIAYECHLRCWGEEGDERLDEAERVRNYGLTCGYEHKKDK
jgi:hypothetical protein